MKLAQRSPRCHAPCRLSGHPGHLRSLHQRHTGVIVRAEGSDVAVASSNQRLDELRSKRLEAEATLASIDEELRAELPLRAAQRLPNFGYIRRFSGEPYSPMTVKGVPGGLMEMGLENFIREGREMLAAFGFKVPNLLRGMIGVAPDEPTPEVLEYEAKLRRLTLDEQAIWDREHARPPVVAPWLIKGPYLFLCWVLDVLYQKRPIARFWLLETVARMPYFSYINVLHLYETLGWWRRSYEARKIHFAEEWNEAHHLLIMEALGGDQRWSDRFIAQHAAVVYFIILQLMWFVSPTLAYNFSELIEAHAVDTYGQFVDENEDLLKSLPPPPVAKIYYESDDLYLFDYFQTSRPPGSRRVKIDNLYDVFLNIRDDEGEHVSTMRSMQDEDVLQRAPNLEAVAIGIAVLTLIIQGGSLGNFTRNGEAADGVADTAGIAADGVWAILDPMIASFWEFLTFLIGLITL